MNRRQSLIDCQKNLLIAWLTGLMPALIIMAIRTVLGAYSGKENEVWAWFVPMFLPTLSLMIGAYSSSALKDEIEAVTVDKFFFTISLWLTGFYLFLLTAIIVYQPFSGSPALETLSRSSIFLGVIQGLTSGCIGVFFVSQKK